MISPKFGILGLLVIAGLVCVLIFSKQKRSHTVVIVAAVLGITLFMLLVPFNLYVRQRENAQRSGLEMEYARDKALSASVARDGDSVTPEHRSNGSSVGVHAGYDECDDGVVAQTSAVAIAPAPPTVVNSRGRAPSMSESDSRWDTARNVGELAAFMCLIYLFLDANRRPRYAWAIRVSSVAAFVGLCIALLSISPL